MSIRVLVNGASGRMGQEAIKAIENDPDLILAGGSDRNDDLGAKIKDTHAQVVVDLTVASTVYQNLTTIIDANAHPVIGTSGLLPAQVDELKEICKGKKLGGIIAPNFSIGAVLMMRFAQEAARYFPNAEIIEYHHNKKQDAPSGTAVKTADMMAAARQEPPMLLQEKELIPGARGAKQQDIPIHAVRLSGLVAHQEVIFGELGQTLTIRHDSISRESFMPGVVLAIRKVMEMNGMVIGLEGLLGLGKD